MAGEQGLEFSERPAKLCRCLSVGVDGGLSSLVDAFRRRTRSGEVGRSLSTGIEGSQGGQALAGERVDARSFVRGEAGAESGLVALHQFTGPRPIGVGAAGGLRGSGRDAVLLGGYGTGSLCQRWGQQRSDQGQGHQNPPCAGRGSNRGPVALHGSQTPAGLASFPDRRSGVLCM